jgi:hypothetical protein
MLIKIQDGTENISHRSYTNTTTAEHTAETPLWLVQAVAKAVI